MRIVLAALLLAAACAHSGRPAAPEERRLQVLFSGDAHGEIGPCG
ncbi:hypothetical protein [Anaeromyxobacter sp. Fw109-5]|nr:hypothetical protein [Anaeromyxobacter sp. Fw109-5]